MLWGIVLQGGPFVEIFSAQGKDPTHGWKVGSGIKREYEKDVKGFLYCLEGSTTTTKLQLPKGKGLSLSRWFVSPNHLFFKYLPLISWIYWYLKVFKRSQLVWLYKLFFEPNNTDTVE